MTNEQLEHILAALIRMEHKTTGSMTTEEYWATADLAKELQAPAFIVDYFATKAIESGDDDTYDEYGVNTKNTFNTQPK